MMKLLAAALALSILSPAFAAAPSFESLGAFKPAFKASPEQQPKPGPILQIEDPHLKPLLVNHAGPIVGRINLAAQLQRHHDLLTRPLGGATWNISAAGDAAFKTYFLAFEQGARLVNAPLGDLNRLRGDGIDVTVEPGVVYNFKVSINIFNPVRGSTLEIHPSKGTRGPSHDVKTGVVIDAVKARSTVFSSDDVEYWALYGIDVDPATNQRTATKSYLFIHMDGLSSKAWPVSESTLPIGQAASVTFGDNQYVLERTATELLVRKP